MPDSRTLFAHSSFTLGSSCQNFKVVATYEVPEISGTAYVLHHIPTSAPVLWLACEDPNKSFTIAFKTPPQDDTGVFHILEHSVLCGSESYPVKEPFVNLLKTSMNTFLNAMTFPDKTMYPVASTNQRDLENLASVYLDAVFHPNIYTRPEIFEQEGWHLEFAEENHQGLMYNGVVFNEMKGALSDPDDLLYNALCRNLFPDTAYGFESGGNPEAIVELTYENFIDHHKRHYNLNNSHTILYGNVDIDRMLALLDDRFECVARDTNRTGTPNLLSVQAPHDAGTVHVFMNTAPQNASAGLGYVIKKGSDRTHMLALEILISALCSSNEAPLKRRLLDAGLASDFNAFVIAGVLQPHVVFILKNTQPAAAGVFRATLESICKDLIAEGIDVNLINAAIAQFEFNMREGDWGGYPDGVALSIQCMSSWLYDEEHPLDYVFYEESLAAIKELVAQGGFETLLEELVLQNDHVADVELHATDTTSEEGYLHALAERETKLTDAEKSEIADRAARLKAMQEAPDAAEDVAKLPRLGLADIDEPAHTVDPVEDREHAIFSRFYNYDTHGISYLQYYFDLAPLKAEDIFYVGVLCEVLGHLDTDQYTAAKLEMVSELYLGDLSFDTQVSSVKGDAEGFSAYLTVSAAALDSKISWLATLPHEIWSTTHFNDEKRIFDLLQQTKLACEARLMTSGHDCAIADIASQLFANARLHASLKGMDFYQRLSATLADWEQQRENVIAKLGELAHLIFIQSKRHCIFVGSEEARASFWKVADTLPLQAVDTPQATLTCPEPRYRSAAHIIPNEVNYIGRGWRLEDTDAQGVALRLLANRILSLEYLWDEVRVKGGAYGAGVRLINNAAHIFFSYRDPNVDKSLATYNKAFAWLSEWAGSDEDFESAQVASIAAFDAPKKPFAKALAFESLLLSAYHLSWHQELRQGYLTATKEAIYTLAHDIAQHIESHEGITSAYVNADLLKEAKMAFELTDNPLQD